MGVGPVPARTTLAARRPRRRAGPPRARGPAARAGGFTFLELVIVMGVIAVIAALGVGFLQNLGRASNAAQAASILAEAGFECRNRSVGGRVATLHLETELDENDNPRIVVSQAVQRPVLTAHFEEAQWFVNAAGPGTATAEGPVTLDPDGKSGSAAAFGQGGRLDFGTQAAFAPTDGVEISVWVRPAGARGTMVVVRGDESYELRLVRDAGVGSTDAYRVQLRLKVVDDDDSPRAAATTWTLFETATAPVLGNRWSEIVASFDGKGASLRVDGVERVKPDAPPTGARARPASPAGGAPAGAKRRRFSATESGGVHLTLSATDAPYVGSVDTLFVQGVFRSAEDRRTLPAGLSLERPGLPAAIRFHNGRLDPQVHRADALVVLVDGAEPGGARWLVRYGLYGLVSPPRLLVGGESPDGRPTTPPAKG